MGSELQPLQSTSTQPSAAKNDHLSEASITKVQKWLTQSQSNQPIILAPGMVLKHLKLQMPQGSNATADVAEITSEKLPDVKIDILSEKDNGGNSLSQMKPIIPLKPTAKEAAVSSVPIDTTTGALGTSWVSTTVTNETVDQFVQQVDILLNKATF